MKEWKEKCCEKEVLETEKAMVSRRKERRRYLVCVGIYVDDFRLVASKSHVL
jgi:hypothetical protein